MLFAVVWYQYQPVGKGADTQQLTPVVTHLQLATDIHLTNSDIHLTPSDIHPTGEDIHPTSYLLLQTSTLHLATNSHLTSTG